MGGGSIPGVAPYVGPDRRQPRGVRRTRLGGRELVALALALLVIGVALPAVLRAFPAADTARHVQGLLRSLSSVCFTCAGVLRLVRWKLTGDNRGGLVGVAFVIYGLLNGPTASLAPLIHNTTSELWLNPDTRAVAVTVCLVILALALRGPEVDARIRPVRTLTVAVGSGGVVIVALIALANTGHSVSLSNGLWLSIGLVQTAVCAALAVAAGLQGVRRTDIGQTWLSISLGILAAAELMHAIAFVTNVTVTLYTTALQVVASGVVLLDAMHALGVVFGADGTRLLNLSGALVATEQQRQAEAEREAEQLHDARSVIAALKATTVTLDAYDTRLDEASKKRLRSAFVDELGRLEKVIDSRRREAQTVFRLDLALEPVLLAEQQNGLVVDNELGDIKVRGRPTVLATVVQNLLVNARRYAPGSSVHLAAAEVDGNVQILVEDRGPGIGPAEQELVFNRGYRGVGAPAGGSGLGLFLARRLMREQGGEIVLRNRLGGGASFALTLPSPTSMIATQRFRVDEVQLS